MLWNHVSCLSGAPCCSELVLVSVLLYTVYGSDETKQSQRLKAAAELSHSSHRRKPWTPVRLAASMMAEQVRSFRKWRFIYCFDPIFQSLASLWLEEQVSSLVLFLIFTQQKWDASAVTVCDDAVATVLLAPVALGAVGFTSAGIAGGSVAAKMMSVAAIANGGGVAAGSTVAVLQSAGKRKPCNNNKHHHFISTVSVHS